MDWTVLLAFGIAVGLACYLTIALLKRSTSHDQQRCDSAGVVCWDCFRSGEAAGLYMARVYLGEISGRLRICPWAEQICIESAVLSQNSR